MTPLAAAGTTDLALAEVVVAFIVISVVVTSLLAVGLAICSLRAERRTN